MSRVVVPGEVVFEVPKQEKNSYVENGKTHASVLGLFDGVKVVSLEGSYEPQEGDVVIGVVVYSKIAGYDVDINHTSDAFLFGKELRVDLHLGSVISAKIKWVDEVRDVELMDARELGGGELIEISAVKVPRVIGKKMSMLTMIREMTGCDILVGKNGRIFVKGERTQLAIAAIRKIEREAHTRGLTERVKLFLETSGKETGTDSKDQGQQSN